MKSTREWHIQMYLHKRPHWFWIDSTEWPIFFIIIVRSFSSSIPCIFKFMTFTFGISLCVVISNLIEWFVYSPQNEKFSMKTFLNFAKTLIFPTTTTTTQIAVAEKKQHISIPFLMLKTCPSTLPTKNRFVIFYFGLKIHSFWHFSKHMYYYRYNNIYSTPGLNGDERWCLNQKFRITNIDKSLWLPSVSPWTFKLCFLVENAKHQVPVKSVSVSGA